MPPPLSCVPISSLSSKALDPTELESEGLVLSLEEQLSALTLSKVDVSEPSPTVSLNGTCFKAELFDDTRRSTKVLLSPVLDDRYYLSPCVEHYARGKSL